MSKLSTIPMDISEIINENCQKRIKPQLLREVKTEALLVFARTALERYFERLDEIEYSPSVGTDEDSVYIYDTLKSLRDDLQTCVVNVDYLINLVQGVQKYPQLSKLYQQELPLIEYYDVMARKVSAYYEDKPAFIPEFLVICVLSNWIHEEEKSIERYSFLKGIDFLELMSKFEQNRDYFQKDGECKLSEIYDLSERIVKKLKDKKFKIKSNRVSKTRKKR